MTKPEPDNMDERVLILAPTGRDASLTGKYLSEAGISAKSCVAMEELCRELSTGAAAALISEEAFTPAALQCLIEALDDQPPWSDFPLVVLTSGGGATPANLKTLETLGKVGNMTLVERPTRVITLVSAIQSALRARRRQYEVRAHLEEEKRSQQERSRLLEEAVKAQKQAEAANRAKDVFLATLSHELRTPLTAVLGWARILRGVKMDDASAQHGLQVIERNAASQNQLIQDLLDVSRIITGKLRLDVRPVELVPIIEAAVDSVQQAVEAKAIQLDTSFDADSALVMGDPDRLQQVVWNLLSNAIKFTPKEGRVSVRLERNGSDVRIKVSDTGQGISPDFLPYVFERFRQADGSTTRSHGGLGLGLAVVRHLVEQHGGSVSAESDGEQQGACFIVNLPISELSTQTKLESAEESHTATDALPDNSGLLNGLRILVVDDHPDARELLTVILTHAGAEVKTAHSAAEALVTIKLAKHDVLVSDLGMPDEDGYSLINRIRSLSSAEGREIPAVALTAYATEEDRQRTLAAGFDYHVTKPVEPTELIAIIANLAERIRGSSSGN